MQEELEQPMRRLETESVQRGLVKRSNSVMGSLNTVFLATSLFLVASLLLVAMPGAPSSFLLLLVRHLLLVAMHLFLVTSLFLVAMPFAPSSFLLLVVRPGAPSSVLAPSSDALCS